MSAKKAKASGPVQEIDVEALISALLKRPVAFQPIFAEITGSVTAGLMLSQMWYWKDKGDDPNGWFYKTQAEWRSETFLTRYEQETARQILGDKGFIKQDRRGQPARIWFKVQTENIIEAMIEAAQSKNFQIAENQQTRLRKTSNQDWGKPAIY